MSYEKRMKDLLGRLVAMTPEPPPYPEEAPLARHRAERTNRPVFAFVAAAALVALLAVPLLLFTGGEEPVVGGSTTTSTTPQTTTTMLGQTTTTGGLTTTTVDGSDTTQPVAEVWSRPVYLYQMPENSFVENPAIVPVWVEVSPLSTDAPFTDALEAIGTDLPPGLENAIPSDVSIISTRLEADHWVADMSEAFRGGAGGLLADFTMLNQLVYTITEGATVDSVLFTVGGEPVEAFGSEGIDLTEPVGRDDFLDQLHVINLTEPIVQTGDGWRVAGVANVFEATLVVNVLDAAGNVTYEEFVTASCGTGCWGDFELTLASDTIIAGESSVRLFQYSAQDGSIVDAVTVAIPEGGSWAFVEDG